MNAILKFFRSSVGKKHLMAITGLMLFVFVIGHMVGNLQIFLGAEVLNGYAVFLKSKPELLWFVRIGLLVLASLHVGLAIQISIENRAARPIPYGENKNAGATYASRTMLMSGLIVLAFIIYHLLHFTVAIPEVNLLAKTPDFPNANFTELKDAGGHQDVFRMVVLGFSNIWVSGIYIIGMAFLGMHLSHGVSSLFQSLGIRQRFCGKCLDRFAILCGIIIFVGNSSIPIAVLLGYGK